MSHTGEMPAQIKGWLSVGEVCERSGLTPATLRYYERLGLVTTTRTGGNQRRYPRHVLRRLAFIAAGQRVGLPLAQIGELLTRLPNDRGPSQQDWTHLAGPWRQLVQARIRELQHLEDSLDGCLGCGCLSLTRCSLFNPNDEAAQEGSGSRWIRCADADTNHEVTSLPPTDRPPGDNFRSASQ